MKNQTGENIQVIIRVRPMMSFEVNRKDQNCIKILGNN